MAQLRPFPRYLRYRQPHTVVSPERPRVDLLVARVRLILVFGGRILAVLSRLYPLPELFIVGVTVYEGFSGPAKVRTDVAEGFLAGLRTLSGGERGVLAVSYGIGGLLRVVWIGLTYATGLENRGEVLSDPVTGVFVVATLGVGTVHVITAIVRLIERLPATLAGESMSAGGKQRIPGVLLPPAALFACYEYVRPYTGGEPYSLTASLPELGIALTLAVVALVPLLRPSVGPHVPLSAYLMVALGPSPFFAIFATAALAFSGGRGTGSANPFVGSDAIFLGGFLPLLGFEQFKRIEVPMPGRGSRMCCPDWVSKGKTFALGAVLALRLDTVAWSTFTSIVFGVIASTMIIASLFAISIRLLLLPFYPPESFANRVGQ